MAQVLASQAQDYADNPNAMAAPGDDQSDQGPDHPGIIDKLLQLMTVTNIADGMDKTELKKIGSKVVREAKIDDDSREAWKKRTEAGMKLALQENKAKTWPWVNCYTLDTDILTVDGWKPIDAVRKGEFVYTRDKDGLGFYAPVTETFFGQTDDLVHFKGKSIDLLVTPNHKMLLETETGRTHFVEAASLLEPECKGKYNYIPLTSQWTGESPPSVHGIPARSYMRLLGWYLSEGFALYGRNIRHRKRTNDVADYGVSGGSLGIAQSRVASADKYEILRADVLESGISFAAHDRGVTLHARSMPQALKDEFRALGDKYVKRIPRHALNMSSDLLAELLDALVLGDGTVRKNGSRSYFSVSKGLIDDVQELCQKIGLRGTVTNLGKRPGGLINGRQVVATTDIYSVSINKKPRLKVGRLHRHAIKQRADVACVEVWPHHTVYVRRNGLAVWCGNSANIQFPLMTTAAIQFAARAYPAIVAGNDVVKAQVTGADEGGQKRARADRIAAHMSWQCLTEMTEWEPGVDTMLHALPIMGCAFKKTYFDPTLGRNRSDHVNAFDFIVNMSAPSIETAPRVTHRITLYPYEIEQRVRAGVFLKDKAYLAPPTETEEGKSKLNATPPDPTDDDAPREFYEQHRRLDLDGDDYTEPYIVTVHKDSETVCRIVAGYDQDGIIVDQGTGQIITIEPKRFFTKIPFIPNPEGGFYDVGFAWLLSPLNRAIDTIINQILDAGTLANTGGGFIGSQLRLKGGSLRFAPGEYKEVDVPGGVVKDNIVSLTFPGPSEVLFKLLGMLIESGREVASVKDVLTGEAPSANTPATTTLALIEQGLKVFTAIYKRIHRAMKEEFGKLCKLNIQYFDPTQYAAFTDVPDISAEDYKGDPVDIVPISDPTMVSDMQRLARAEFLERFKGQPGIDVNAINRRQFEAAGIDNIEELFLKQQGPSPEALAHYAELEATIANMNAKTENLEAQGILFLEQAATLAPGQQLDAMRLWIESFVAHNDAAQGAQGSPATGGATPSRPIKPPLLPAPIGSATPAGTVTSPMAKAAGVAPQ